MVATPKGFFFSLLNALLYHKMTLGHSFCVSPLIFATTLPEYTGGYSKQRFDVVVVVIVVVAGAAAAAAVVVLFCFTF